MPASLRTLRGLRGFVTVVEAESCTLPSPPLPEDVSVRCLAGLALVGRDVEELVTGFLVIVGVGCGSSLEERPLCKSDVGLLVEVAGLTAGLGYSFRYEISGGLGSLVGDFLLVFEVGGFKGASALDGGGGMGVSTPSRSSMVEVAGDVWGSICRLSNGSSSKEDS